MTQFRRILRCFATLATAAFLLIGPGAEAGILIGVGQDPPPPMGPFFGSDTNEDMIMVGTETNPIPIVPEYTGPPWMKQFVINRDGQGWSTSGPLSMVSVMEFITIAPSPTAGTTTPQITDWHEDIDPTVGDGADFKWAGGAIITPLGVFPGSTSGDGKSIWFNFPPLPIGTTFKINKNLMWAGPTPITPGPAGSNNYTIKINERPSVPEPSSLFLAGLSLACIVSGVPRRKTI